MTILQQFPIILLIIALSIPLFYCFFNKKEMLKKIIVLFLMGVVIIILYPIVSIFESVYGYFLGKAIIFTLIPLITVIYLEKIDVKKAFSELGVKRDNLEISIFYGLIAFLFTVIFSLKMYWGITANVVVDSNIVMFFEAFNEEFLFRGVLFLYLWKITDIRIAYATSIIGFILIHPQHFESFFIVSTTAQAILLAFVTHETKNIVGPWISHGLNRIVPNIIRALIF